jgi:N12 class adenine-specific DNA methylase
MRFQVTVRYGSRYQRYHTLEVDGTDVRDALRAAAEEVPEEIAGEADLVEMRPAVDPEKRSYLGEEG